VKLDLGFWKILVCDGGPGNGQISWQRVGGHAVTVAGVDSQNSLFAISDPDNDAAESGGLGVIRPVPNGHPLHPNDTSIHNIEANASHDIYTVVPSASPGGIWALKNYPGKVNFPTQEWGQPTPTPWPPYFYPCEESMIITEIEAAVIVSPIICGNNVVDPGETCDPPGGQWPPNGNPCRQTCTYCGDGIVNNGEACDDGNNNNNDGCTNNCTLVPNVTCSFAPDGTRLIRGGTLRFGATANNNTGNSQTFQFATKVELPNHTMYPSSGYGLPYLLGPITIPNLAPHASISRQLTQVIPLNAPYGTYTYHGYVGVVGPPPLLYNQCQFNFEVVR
jgi:cysteine-rich repeat protein